MVCRTSSLEPALGWIGRLQMTSGVVTSAQANIILQIFYMLSNEPDLNTLMAFFT